MAGVKGRITMSIIIYCALFAEAKQISRGRSATVYKRAASMSTRIIGIRVPFVVRIVETLRSIIQMRYDSNPGHIHLAWGLDIALT